MSINLSYIKEYLNLKPVEEITKISDSDKEYQTEVFSCLSFIKDFKNIENKLFTEIEENFFDIKFIDYYDKYDKLVEDSMIDIPEVSTKTIKKHFKYFNSFYENFDSLYKLLVNPDAIFCLAQEWIENNEEDKPKGPEEWVEIQEDIYHFTKRETVKRIKEKFNEYKPIGETSKKEKLLEVNPYPNIFKNFNSYELFRKYTIDINNDIKLAEFSFIYRRMRMDKLIYDTIGPQDFIIFLSDNNFGVINRIKSLDDISNKKTSHYYHLKEANKPY